MNESVTVDPGAQRLSLASLPIVPQGVVRVPEFRPRDLSIGHVHLGIGAFHRAHQAVFSDDAIAMSAECGWGICGVTQRSRAVVDQLTPQDGLYSILQRGRQEMSLRVVGAVREVLSGPDEVGTVLDRLASPSVHVLTLTVTEKGYCRDGGARLDLADPRVAHDLDSEEPRSAVAQVSRGLERRWRAGGATDHGHLLRQPLLERGRPGRAGARLRQGLRGR